MAHNLKIWPKYFKEVKSGAKTFEYRKNDRDFKTGDTVVLHEWDNETEEIEQNGQKETVVKAYTGEKLEFKIGYILPVPDSDYVVFSLIK